MGQRDKGLGFRVSDLGFRFLKNCTGFGGKWRGGGGWSKVAGGGGKGLIKVATEKKYNYGPIENHCVMRRAQRAKGAAKIRKRKV